MAKEAKQTTCPHRCPLCALYEAQETFREGISECVPHEVSSHLNLAGRELLLAVRALLDKGLETLTEEPKPGTRRKAQRIKVE
jgi:hypothetical protein